MSNERLGNALPVKNEQRQTDAGATAPRVPKAPIGIRQVGRPSLGGRHAAADDSRSTAAAGRGYGGSNGPVAGASDMAARRHPDTSGGHHDADRSRAQAIRGNADTPGGNADAPGGNADAPGSHPDSEAEAFVRFCYRRRAVGWPDLYDEMCAVAARGEYRGMDYEQLYGLGIRLTLAALPYLASVCARVIAEERGPQRMSVVA